MQNNILDTIKTELPYDSPARTGPVLNAQDWEQIIEKLKQQTLNIMFVGATGVGKSSTINAIFNMDVAKVGDRVDPETSTIQKYEIDNMVLWDTPGLGDSPENDKRYAGQIVNALKAKDAQGNFLIDEVVVLVDGSSRDLKTTYEVIENVIAPFIGDPKRIVVAINQCDMAMKGRGWNYDTNEPELTLVNFLSQKAASVHDRILESTGIDSTPVVYSALHHYNISKLLLSMIQSIPEERRFLFVDALNKEPEIWKKNDATENYNQEIQKKMTGSLTKAIDCAAKGAIAGATIGNLIPVIGPVLGATVGAALGFLGGLLE